MDDRRFEFRFLSGSNIGASLVLPQGEYILGNTDKSDIVIYDNAIEKSELKLFLTEEGVFAEALSGNWLINNSQLKGKQSLPSGDLLSLGLNTLAWHKEGDPFAAFTSFSVKETNDVVLHAQSEQDIKDEASAKANISGLTAQNTNSKTEHPIANKSKSTYKSKIFIGAVILALLLFLLIFGNVFDSKASIDEEIAAIKNQSSSFFVDPVQVNFKDGIYVVSGSVLDQENYEKLMKSIPHVSYPVEIKANLISAKALSIKHAFSLYGITVNPALKGNDFVVYGYICDPYYENDIFNALNSHLSEQNIKSGFTYRSQLEPFIQEKISQLNLPVSLIFDKGFVVYDGKFTPDQYQDFLTLQRETADFCKAPVIFRDIRTMPKGNIDLLPRDAVSVTYKDSDQKLSSDNEKSDLTDPVSVLPFNLDSISGVTLEPLRFVSLKNGDKYFEGAELPNGYILEKISVNELILDKKGEKITYELK